MNGYRSYMDHIRVSPELHRRLMEASPDRAAPPRRRAPLPRLLAAAACCVLVLAAGWGGFRLLSPQTGGDLAAGLPVNDAPQPGGKGPYDPGGVTPDGVIPPPAGETPAPTDEPKRVHPIMDDPYSLFPQDPFEGEAHSQPALEWVAFGEAAGELSVDKAYPKGSFTEDLTRAQMTVILGGQGAENLPWADEGAGDIPWTLGWAGYRVRGSVRYDAGGQVMEVWLTGQSMENEWDTFTLVLAPGGNTEDYFLPDVYETGEVCGTEVKAAHYPASREGQAVYAIALDAGGVGLTFHATNWDAEAAAQLATLAANHFAGPDAAVHLDTLSPKEIPDWKSEDLTLDEARAEEGLGRYVPDRVPEGFSFESAHREQNQDMDVLSVNWTGGYTYLTLNIEFPLGEELFADVGDPASYDVRLYERPWGDSVPGEYWNTFNHPLFLWEDMTAEVVAARMYYVDDDAGDVPAWRGDFSIRYPDGVQVSYYFDGVTPEEACTLLGL